MQIWVLYSPGLFHGGLFVSRESRCRLPKPSWSNSRQHLRFSFAAFLKPTSIRAMSRSLLSKLSDEILYEIFSHLAHLFEKRDLCNLALQSKHLSELILPLLSAKWNTWILPHTTSNASSSYAALRKFESPGLISSYGLLGITTTPRSKQETTNSWSKWCHNFPAIVLTWTQIYLHSVPLITCRHKNPHLFSNSSGEMTLNCSWLTEPATAKASGRWPYLEKVTLTERTSNRWKWREGHCFNIAWHTLNICREGFFWCRRALDIGIAPDNSYTFV
jgi:hypothetical protein